MLKTMQRTILMAAAVLLLSACAGTSTPRDETPEQGASRRAQERWDALLGNDWERAYGYLTPGHRELNSFEDFRTRMLDRKVQWLSSKVQSVRCDQPERCIVKVNVAFKLIGGMPGQPDMQSFNLMDETWLNLDGQWYFLPVRTG